MALTVLQQVKADKGIPDAVTVHDNTINQKIAGLRSYLTGAGVSEEMLDDELATTTIAMGVCDIWNPNSGEGKFSSLFHTLTTQLCGRSLPVVVDDTVVVVDEDV